LQNEEGKREGEKGPVKKGKKLERKRGLRK